MKMPCSTATSTALLLLCKVLLLYVQKAECATAAGGVIRGGGVYKTGMMRASERANAGRVSAHKSWRRCEFSPLSLSLSLSLSRSLIRPYKL